jgi:hypothetical protein
VQCDLSAILIESRDDAPQTPRDLETPPVHFRSESYHDLFAYTQLTMSPLLSAGQQNVCHAGEPDYAALTYYQKYKIKGSLVAVLIAL